MLHQQKDSSINYAAHAPWQLSTHSTVQSVSHGQSVQQSLEYPSFLSGQQSDGGQSSPRSCRHSGGHSPFGSQTTLHPVYTSAVRVTR